jgi:hypothetical protein
MAIAFGAIGTKGSGTTTVSLASPSGTADTQLLIAGRSAWEPALTFTNETNWTLAAQDESVGTGTAANAHLTGVRADYRILTGSLAGPTVFDQSGAEGCSGVMLSYTREGSDWDTIASTTGDDSSHGANRSMTGVGSIDFAPGDMLIGVVSVDTDSALTISAPAFTASGITFGTTTRRTSGAGSGAGDNGNIEVFDALVSSGSGTVAPTLAFTTATSQCGGVVFVRLREVSGSDTPQAVDATSSMTPAIVKVPRFAVTIPATSTMTPTISRLVSYLKVVAATSTVVPAISKRLNKLLEVSSTMTAVLARATPKLLEVSSTVSVGMLVQYRAVRNLDATSVCTADLTTLYIPDPGASTRGRWSMLYRN